MGIGNCAPAAPDTPIYPFTCYLPPPPPPPFPPLPNSRFTSSMVSIAKSGHCAVVFLISSLCSGILVVILIYRVVAAYWLYRAKTCLLVTILLLEAVASVQSEYP